MAENNTLQKSLKPSSGDDSVRISLIIPCYNVPEEQISRALASVWKQTFSDFEVIVVDDGSQEPYRTALQQLCVHSEKTTLIRTENRGVSAARNTGIHAARGLYIAFLDADDVLADDYMERAWAAVVETRADFVIGGNSIIDRPESFHVSPRTSPLPYSLYTAETVKELYPHLIGPQFLMRFADGHIGRGPWARLVRSGLVNKTPFDEELCIGEDIIWNLQLLNCCRTICVVQESWYGYWRNPDSVSRSYSAEYIEECRKGLAMIPACIDLTDDVLYRAYADRIYEMMRRCWNYYLRKARNVDRRAYRAAVKSLYTKSPWTELGSFRYMTTGGRYRKDMLLFRLHLYFEVVARRERRTRK